jgi:hypothetical protein
MVSPNRRRWFQFGLGTMLLAVTVFAALLGWELDYIRERKEFLAWVESTCAAEGNHTFSIDTLAVPAEIPMWRRWMGDKPADVITLPFVAAEADADKARALFPEARIER